MMSDWWKKRKEMKLIERIIGDVRCDTVLIGSELDQYFVEQSGSHSAVWRIHYVMPQVFLLNQFLLSLSLVAVAGVSTVLLVVELYLFLFLSTELGVSQSKWDTFDIK